MDPPLSREINNSSTSSGLTPRATIHGLVKGVRFALSKLHKGSQQPSGKDMSWLCFVQGQWSMKEHFTLTFSLGD